MNTYHVAVPENSHDLPHPTKVVPFGIYGGGLLTGPPIGLVIVIGLLFMGFVGLPEARWFFALAVPAGAIRVPVSLLDTRRQGPMGGNVVPGRDRRRKSRGPTSERDVFQESYYSVCCR